MTTPPVNPVEKVYDIGVGRYDITVSVGPSFQSKRQEAAQSMLALLSTVPEIFPVIGDLLIRQMDWPFAKEIADRLKKQLPPQLQDGDQNDPETRAQVANSKLQVLMQQHEVMAKELKTLSDIVHTKRLELESKERQVAMQVQGQLIAAQLKAEGAAANEMLKAELGLIQQRLQLLHEGESIDQEVAGGIQPPVPDQPPQMQ